MWAKKPVVLINDNEYKLEINERDKYVAQNLSVAFCDELATDFMPILYDPRGHGSAPYPPEMIAYRLVIDPLRQKLCALYEVYWKRQDCTWKELNKDHDHDYEQIQVHFDLPKGEIEKVVVSSTGPIENGGHGVEVYSDVLASTVRSIVYTTASDVAFPWGGKTGQINATQVRGISIGHLLFENHRSPVVVLNCYHAFAGLKRSLSTEEKIVLDSPLERLDGKLLDKWYYLHTSNRFGHDVSNPFKEPHILYYPPPEDWFSKLSYGFLWIFSFLKRAIGL
jgi:hypothetical protein